MSYEDWISTIQNELLGSWEHPNAKEIYTFLPGGKLLIKDKSRADLIELPYSIIIEEDACLLTYSDKRFLVKDIGKTHKATYYFILEDENGQSLRFTYVY